MLAGARGYAALGTGVAAVAGSMLALLPHHTGARVLASDCGLVACGAAVPSPVIATVTASPGTLPPDRGRKPRRNRHQGKPRPHRTPKPKPPVLSSPAAPAAQPAGPPPAVTVAYVLTQQWNGGFHGQFTITNHGTSWLDNWQLAATLPGDQVTSASGAAYQASGGTLTFQPALLQGGLAPGASLTLSFTAEGATTRPAGCTLNGSACAS